MLGSGRAKASFVAAAFRGLSMAANAVRTIELASRCATAGRTAVHPNLVFGLGTLHRRNQAVEFAFVVGAGRSLGQCNEPIELPDRKMITSDAELEGAPPSRFGPRSSVRLLRFR